MDSNKIPIQQIQKKYHVLKQELKDHKTSRVRNKILIQQIQNL